jgi:hypothetical protein
MSAFHAMRERKSFSGHASTMPRAGRRASDAQR